MTERLTLVASLPEKRHKRDLAVRYVMIGYAMPLPVDVRSRRKSTAQQRTEIERRRECDSQCLQVPHANGRSSLQRTREATCSTLLSQLAMRAGVDSARETPQTSAKILSAPIGGYTRCSHAIGHGSKLGDAKHVSDHQTSGSDAGETATGKC